MPPKTAWEWLEAYGGIEAAPEDIFNSWDRAMETTTALADKLLPEEDMDQILKATREKIALKSGTLRFKGDGNAALEELRSGRKLAPQLDFGTTGLDEEEFNAAKLAALSAYAKQMECIDAKLLHIQLAMFYGSNPEKSLFDNRKIGDMTREECNALLKEVLTRSPRVMVNAGKILS